MLFSKDFRQEIKRARIYDKLHSEMNIRYVIAETGTGDFFLDTRDRVISREIVAKGSFDKETFDVAIRILGENKYFDGPKGMFLDIGANIATHTIYAMKSGLFSKAILFEPSPSNFEILQRNLSLNGIEDKCTAVNVALGNESGQLNFEMSESNFGDHRVRVGNVDNLCGTEHYGESVRETIQVPCTTLDDVLGSDRFKAEKCSLIWMDVQGFEGHILSGAKSVLNRDIPLCLEFWPYGLVRSGGDRLLIENLLGSFGHFYDLREKSPVKRRIEEISNLFDRLKKSTNSSDILLV
jgi:FkbM family methyltransferase